MRIVVAGAAGNLGYEVTNVLMQQGHDVVAMDMNTQRLEPLRPKLAGLHSIDLRLPDGLENILKSADLVVTTVGIGRPKKLTDFRDVDNGSNLNLLNAAKEMGIQKFIYISVAGVDTDLSVPLLRAKYDFEAELTRKRASLPDYPSVQYFTDVWRNIRPRLKKVQITLIKTDEEFRFSPVHPRDVAEFIAANLLSDDRIANVGGPEQFTYTEIANLCFDLLKKPPNLTMLSIPLLRLLLSVMKPFIQLCGVFSGSSSGQAQRLDLPTIGSAPCAIYLREQLPIKTQYIRNSPCLNYSENTCQTHYYNTSHPGDYHPGCHRSRLSPDGVFPLI
jgi:uncharacterized protein YbjT (DUF2867 family)